MMINAYAPANISCFFKPVIDKRLQHSGSVGLGFTINKGVTAEVYFSNKTEIFFNQKKINFPTVVSVTNAILGSRATPESYHKKADFGYRMGTASSEWQQTRMTGVRVFLSSSLPLGYGFGLSGASALAAAYAINKLLDLKKSKLELAKIAHRAEVENKTGLGDVVNQYFGGCLLKRKPSYLFAAERISLEGTAVYCKIFSKILTKKVLSNSRQLEFISSAADRVMGLITINITFSDLVSISKQFAKESGLLKNQQVLKIIQDIEFAGGHASMIMLGNGVFSDIPFTGSSCFRITNNSARYL